MDMLPANIEMIANREFETQRFGGILTCAEFPALHGLTQNMDYVGSTWCAKRRKIGQLDQVAFWRKH